MRLYAIRAGLMAAVLGLAACSGGADRPSANLQLIGALRSEIASRTAEKPAPPKVTRAVLDELDGSFMEATLENGNLVAYMFVNAERTGANSERVTVWRTYDDVTLAMRNGVLIQTRGLGGDLLSTETGVSASRPGPADSGERVQYIRDGDDGVLPLALACGVTDLGPEAVEIFEITHATRHLRERCEGGGGTVINDYWIDSGSRLVRQSRQWGGPYVGYLRFRRLTE